MSWCPLIDSEGRMAAMINTTNSASSFCPEGSLSTSVNFFEGSEDLLVCADQNIGAVNYMIRFTTDGVCPSGRQALPMNVSASSVDTSQESLVTLLDAIFVFDVGTCSAVVGASLLMFYISHSAGNIVRWLGRF